jgi:hypothetical protein
LKRRLFKVSGISMLVVFAFAIVACPAVAASYPGSNFQWQAGSVGAQSDLYGVTALDSAHAWAVGQGSIFFYDGASWTPQEAGTTDTIEAVDAVDPRHVWAVTAQNGDALRFDGASWQVEDPQPGVSDRSYLYGVDALDSTHVWAVGIHSTICSWDGFSWTAQQGVAGTDYALMNVYAADASHVWAVGERGKVLFFNGTAWAPQASGTTEHLYGITGIGADHVWASGWDGTIIFWNGSGWRAQQSNSIQILRGISAADNNHVWAVGEGEDSDVLFFNGASWSKGQLGAANMRDVAAVSSGEAWAAGALGKVSHGTAVQPVATTRTWAHDSIGVTVPSTNWYLAEGCTAGGFETWILVQNPDTRTAHVSLTYMTPTGAVAGPAVAIQGKQRRTFNVAEVLPGAQEVSTHVSSDIAVVAERAMYGNGGQWGTDSIGAPETSERWYLAEGCTAGGFETWVLVQNPGSEPAEVSLSYMTSSGLVGGPTATLGARQRVTFNVADTVHGAWEVSTMVTADQPVVAERAMYGGNRTWAHDSIGVTSYSTVWYLAEGCTMPGFETWILIQNPGASGTTVNLTYMTPSGPVAGPSETIEAHSRKTFNVGDTVLAWEVSTRVDSDMPVIAERAMYGNGRSWGTDSVGVTEPATDWYLAEGSTGQGFETWVLVQNPNAEPVQVTLTFMTVQGAIPGPSVRMEPNSRMTFNVWETVSIQWEVSTAVHSDKPVIAERAMYGDR